MVGQVSNIFQATLERGRERLFSPNLTIQRITLGANFPLDI